MRKRLTRFTLCLICIGFLLSSIGCSMRLADLSMISTKSVELDKVDIDKLPQTRNVIGKDEVFIFLFFPIPFRYLHLENAIDDALEKGRGDLLVDAVIRSKSWWFIFGQQSLEVKGTVVKTRHNI